MSDAPAATAAPTAAPAAPTAPQTTPQQAAPQPTPTPETKQEAKKWKLKVDGQEQEYGEEELVKAAQLGKAAHKRMEEAATLRKQVDSFIKELKENPRKILADPNIGVDLKKFAEDIMNEEIEEMKKSPEQREKEKLQKELEDLRAKQKDTEERANRAEFERLAEQETLRLDNEITEALDTSGLPKSPYIVKRLADYMLLALQNNIDMSVNDAIPLVRKEIAGDLRNLFTAAPDELLEEMIGKDSISRLRKRQVAKLKEAAPNASQVKATGKEAPKEDEKSKKITMKEFFKL